MKIGDRFGKLTVRGFDGLYAACECECGNRKRIRKTSLTDKKQPTRSCGCIQKQIARKTGIKTIAENSKKQIERNVLYNTNFQVITSEKIPSNNTSGVKGVSWSKSRQLWETYIQIHGKRINLGRYADFTEAVKVRKEAEEKYFKPLIDGLKAKENKQMENIIKSMIEKAIYYKENLSLYNESRELLQFVAQLIEQMALTINCPSNWRNIGTELAEEYKDNTWIFDELELWNYEE